MHTLLLQGEKRWLNAFTHGLHAMFAADGVGGGADGAEDGRRFRAEQDDRRDRCQRRKMPRSAVVGHQYIRQRVKHDQLAKRKRRMPGDADHVRPDLVGNLPSRFRFIRQRR